MSLKLSDNELYLQSSPNAPLAHRPLCLQMGKESVSSLRSLESYENDITLLWHIIGDERCYLSTGQSQNCWSYARW